MKHSPILIVSGEPNSVFIEIFFKILKKKIKSPIILIASQKILEVQMKKFKVKKKINILKVSSLEKYNLNNKSINLIDVKYSSINTFKKITKKSKTYINNSFKIAFEILKKGKIQKFINGPISKNKFLNNRHLGITEYISEAFSKKKTCMLIYNDVLSVCPVTTHLPIKLVPKQINKKNISEKVFLIDNFYKKKFGYKPKIAILGLNPHCESIHKFNEDEKIIKPAIKFLKSKYSVFGPFPADTIFLKNNRKKFDVILGMYHDQVLTPLKTIFEFDAINITLGLPFDRISPDHGPNEKMVGKNLSNPLSLLKAIQFLDKH